MNRDTRAGGMDDDRWAEDDGDRWDDDRSIRAPDRSAYPPDERGEYREGGGGQPLRGVRADRGRPMEGRSSGTPVRIALAIAAVGSIVFLALAIIARDIPLLASAAAVLGIVFVALAVAGGRATYRAATDGENRRAFALAVGGGLAAMIGLGALAMAIVLALIWQR